MYFEVRITYTSFDECGFTEGPDIVVDFLGIDLMSHASKQMKAIPKGIIPRTGRWINQTMAIDNEEIHPPIRIEVIRNPFRISC